VVCDRRSLLCWSCDSRGESCGGGEKHFQGRQSGGNQNRDWSRCGGWALRSVRCLGMLGVGVNHADNPETPVEEEEMPEIEVDDAALAEWIASDRKTVLLDIREPVETRNGFAKGALLIPMNSVPDRLEELPDRDVCLLVYCAAGARSFGVTHWLREQGWAEAWSVSGGFAAVVGAGVEREVV
jgi:rhodanese-related sulfurtransferase